MDKRVIALVAGFKDDGELLLLKRPDDTHLGGLWSFPGGKVEANEKPEEAAIRELMEETGLTGRNWQFLGETCHVYPDRTLIFHLFACQVTDASALHPESGHAWAAPDHLAQYPMPEANTALLGFLSGKSPAHR